MKSEANDLLTIRNLFRAYAESTEESVWKKVHAYRIKRLQLLEALFNAPISDEDSYEEFDHFYISALAERWLEHRSADPFRGSFLIGGPTPADELVRDYLPRLATAINGIRDLYEEMAVIVLARTFPNTANRTVRAARLHELGLPLNEPTDCGESLKHVSTDGRYGREEVAAAEAQPDSVTEEDMDRLKEAEEVVILAEHRRKEDYATIVERAIAAGICEAATTPGRIYDLSAEAFLELARDLPHMSRVDFKPRKADE